MSIADALRKNRPNLGDGTVKTYCSIIRSLYRRMLPDKPTVDTDHLQHYFDTYYKKVLTFLEDLPYAKRKTVLAALVVFTPSSSSSHDAYRKQMIADADQYNADRRKQVKSDDETKNWVSQDYILQRLNELEQETRYLWSKSDLNNSALQKLQDYVILSLYTLIPPRRLLDYTSFRVRNINKETDNYMEGNKFIFNTYKTKNKYGRQVVQIPNKLKNIILKWKKKHNYDTLLFLENGNPMPTPRLTLKLNKIFNGRNISVNMLRHIFITEKVLPDIPALKKLDTIAKDMGHSVDQQLLYKKVD